MLTYKAGYKFVGGSVHAQVIDFPGVITCASDLDEARRLLVAALLDMAETRLELGQPLLTPDSQATDSDMDFEEPIYLHLSASTEVEQIPAGQVAT